MSNAESIGLRMITFHVRAVQANMYRVMQDLLTRMIGHDASKLEPEELALVVGKSRLNSIAYGTPEYNAALAEVKEAVDHHYSCNPHHPDYYDGGVSDMSLLDLLEMLCDWKAAAEENSSTLAASIDTNVDRFDISKEMAAILRKTAKDLGWI